MSDRQESSARASGGKRSDRTGERRSGSDGRILVRESGTEPLLRVMVGNHPGALQRICWKSN